jgi:hypothetical protein
MSIVLCLLISGCGGGGGGNSNPTTPPPPPPPPPTEGIFFTVEAEPGPGTIYLDGVDTTNTSDDFVLEVRANEVEDLYGVSFDLQFPADLLSWRRGRFAEGDFLNGGGAIETEILVDRRPAGNIVVGITRVGEVEGANGSGLLLSLEFVNEAVPGTGEFTFSDNDAVDSSSAIQEDTGWLAGNIESKT